MRFGVLLKVTVNMANFWDETPYIVATFSEGTCCYLPNLNIRAALPTEMFIKLEQTVGCCILEYNLQQTNTCNRELKNSNFNQINSGIYNFTKYNTLFIMSERK
jgi:hypothetical protein